MPLSVLIVEDEFLIAMEMEEVLHDLGYRSVGIADDMESALEKATSSVDLALVDVNLADGATGPRIGEHLAKNLGIEVIFVTANPTHLDEGVEGAIGALEKPVDLAVLGEVLDYVIAVRQGADVQPPAHLRTFGN